MRVSALLSDPEPAIAKTLHAMMTTPHLGPAGAEPVIASEEAVCVVFEKANTGGKPLDAYELVTAM